MHSRIAAALRAVLLVAATLPAGEVRAHEGHDHDEGRAVSAATIPRGEATSGPLELVAVLRDGTLTVYIDRVATNEPVTGAGVAVETPNGPAELTAGPDGTYGVAVPWADKPGRHDLLFTVIEAGAAEVLAVNLVVPDSTASAGAGLNKPLSWAAFRERVARLDPVLFAVSALAFVLGIALALTVRLRRPVPGLAILALGLALIVATNVFAHDGEDHHEDRPPAGSSATRAPESDRAQRFPDGTVFVPKPTQRILSIRTLLGESATHTRTVELPGRIIADPNASGVVQSSVGGRLSAPQGGFPRLGTPVKAGAVLAYVTPPVQRVDVSDMRQRQGELDQQTAIVQRRVDRYLRLAPSGAVAQVQLDEAAEELRGLKDRRAALDAIRSEPEALIAPVDGVVAETSAVAGQMASPGAVVFQIIDPARLWIEALSFEAMTGDKAASARLADGRTLRLAYRGSGFADRNQSAPIHFAIEGGTKGLRVGQFVTVQAETGEHTEGVALPRSSIVRASNGQDVVYEHIAAERFVARPVRVSPLDSERVLVAAGLGPGRRIVRQGAELLDQVR